MSDDVRDRLRTLAQIANDYPATLATHILDEFVVIPKSDLPEVVEDAEAGIARVGSTSWPIDMARRVGAGTFRKNGLALLALADHLEAGPPVDEAQVEALGHLIASRGLDEDGPTAMEFARRLVRAGVRVEVAK